MRLLGLLVCCILNHVLYASVSDNYSFATVEQQQLFKKLSSELRCVVCQNQSLADSQAPLAADLRAQIAHLIQNGHNTQEVKQYLQARYGDYVLYRPPLKANTAVLWFAPLCLLIIAVVIVSRQLRFRQWESKT